jgi:phage protein|nr:MAG TPA: homing endonuclease [Caudoviricetes sp.]
MKYEKEHIDFIKAHQGASAREMAELFTKHFNIHVTKNQMKGVMYRNNISSGKTGRFEKGHIPNSKGQKMSKEQYEKCKPTMFKKGHIPKNHREIGSERITKDGYIEVKIEDPDVWGLKHRLIYEEHYGEIPAGYSVIFGDGDKLNCNIDNLILVSRSELLIMNRNKLIKNDSVLTKVGVNIAKLLDTMNKKKRE